MNEDIMNHKKALQEIADSFGEPRYDTYKLAAENFKMMFPSADYWKHIKEDTFLLLQDCGMKQTNNYIDNVIDEFIDAEEHIKARLCYVVNVVECSDEDIKLYEYGQTKPANCAEGCSCDDDEFVKNADGREKYKYYYTNVTMLKGETMCVFIDCEGYDYCRYVLLLEEWEDMFIEEIKHVYELKEQDAKDALLFEVQQILNTQAYSPWVDLTRPSFNDFDPYRD